MVLYIIINVRFNVVIFSPVSIFHLIVRFNNQRQCNGDKDDKQLLNSHLCCPLQACRQQLYADITQDDQSEEHMKRTATTPNDVEQVCEYLIYLMSTESSPYMDSRGSRFGNQRLLEEMELFSRILTVEDDS